MYRWAEALLERRPRWLALFAPISWGWSFFAWVRNLLYDFRILPVERLSKPVISIGNIVAGGVGKTPLVCLIAEALAPRRIAILSRGYRTQDEPELLRRRLPDAKVYVDADRVRAGKRAIQEGADVLLLDDGFQYRRLHRDLDLLILNSRDPQGGGHFLPWGLLRDSPKRIRKADFIFTCPAPKELARTNEIGVSLSPIGWRGVEPPKGSRVALFCGIARPERFRETIEQMGYRVANSLFLPDHGAPTEAQLRRLLQGSPYLVCTEKDWVKLPPRHSLPIGALIVEMRVMGGAWDACKAALHLACRPG